MKLLGQILVNNTVSKLFLSINKRHFSHSQQTLIPNFFIAGTFYIMEFFIASYNLKRKVQKVLNTIMLLIFAESVW